MYFVCNQPVLLLQLFYPPYTVDKHVHVIHLITHVHVHYIDVHPLYRLLFVYYITMKINVKHCWGRAHMSAYLGNLWKVVLLRKSPFKQQERGSVPIITCRIFVIIILKNSLVIDIFQRIVGGYTASPLVISQITILNIFATHVF